MVAGYEELGVTRGLGKSGVERTDSAIYQRLFTQLFTGSAYR